MSDREPQDQWSIHTRLKPGAPGQGVVTFNLMNGRHGALPPFDVQVDWKEGMEPQDVEVFALALVGNSLRHLGEDILQKGVDLMRSS